jgi:hypothetical protein
VPPHVFQCASAPVPTGVCTCPDRRLQRIR